jgi:hypothetical protein
MHHLQTMPRSIRQFSRYQVIAHRIGPTEKLDAVLRLSPEFGEGMEWIGLKRLPIDVSHAVVIHPKDYRKLLNSFA